MVFRFWLNRRVVNAYLNVLTVVAERFAKERKPADMVSIVIDGHPEPYFTLKVKLKIINSYIRYF